MKRVILSGFLLILLSPPLFSSPVEAVCNGKRRYIEYSTSLNKTFDLDKFNNNQVSFNRRVGFGLAVRQVKPLQTRLPLSMIVGLEYNETRDNIGFYSEDWRSYYYDLSFEMHRLTIPIIFRYSYIRTSHWAGTIELGGLADISFVRMKGFSGHAIPESPVRETYKETEENTAGLVPYIGGHIAVGGIYSFERIKLGLNLECRPYTRYDWNAHPFDLTQVATNYVGIRVMISANRN